jgi:hypothetical protein
MSVMRGWDRSSRLRKANVATQVRDLWQRPGALAGQQGEERIEAVAAISQDVMHCGSSSADDAVAAATQAFENDSLAPFARIEGSGHATRQRTGDGAFESIAVIVEFAKQCPGTRAHHGRSGSFLIELPLVAGQRLARGKVALEGRRRGTVQNGCVVRAAVGAGANNPRHGDD